METKVSKDTTAHIDVADTAKESSKCMHAPIRAIPAVIDHCTTPTAHETAPANVANDAHC